MRYWLVSALLVAPDGVNMVVATVQCIEPTAEAALGHAMRKWDIGNPQYAVRAPNAYDLTDDARQAVRRLGL